ncbi:hypothetical protein DUI87_10674 [Hirundo rustica rustica]|uniref:Uncharacterized protein n=1 Tax=Hirundo rustica rustica TaxID=333673 RepID=A0A3M0KJ93_HIRRU|nr:hypothetical protein DUI87_10674 [Hirundo rustica rustica]
MDIKSQEQLAPPQLGGASHRGMMECVMSLVGPNGPLSEDVPLEDGGVVKEYAEDDTRISTETVAVAKKCQVVPARLEQRQFLSRDSSITSCRRNEGPLWSYEVEKELGREEKRREKRRREEKKRREEKRREEKRREEKREKRREEREKRREELEKSWLF